MIERQPTPAEGEILTAVSRYHFATIDQIMLHLSLEDSKLRATQIKLKTLVDREYLLRIDREHTGTSDKLKPAYHISKKAQSYLRDVGLEAVLYKEPNPGQLNHVFSVNSVLLLAQVCANRYPEQISLIDSKHDYVLRQKQLSVTPDGFLHFALKTKEGELASYPILIEVDRSTESQTTIEGKIEAYVAFTRGEYQRVFRLEALTIAWFITGQEGRLFNLQATMEKVLMGLKPARLRQFFYLGRLEEKPANATSDMAGALFTSDHFIVPFQGTKRFPLLTCADPPGFPDQRQ